MHSKPKSIMIYTNIQNHNIRYEKVRSGIKDEEVSHADVEELCIQNLMRSVPGYT